MSFIDNYKYQKNSIIKFYPSENTYFMYRKQLPQPDGAWVFTII